MNEKTWLLWGNEKGKEKEKTFMGETYLWRSAKNLQSFVFHWVHVCVGYVGIEPIRWFFRHPWRLHPQSSAVERPSLNRRAFSISLTFFSSDPVPDLDPVTIFFNDFLWFGWPSSLRLGCTPCDPWLPRRNRRSQNRHIETEQRFGRSVLYECESHPSSQTHWFFDRGTVSDPNRITSSKRLP